MNSHIGQLKDKKLCAFLIGGETTIADFKEDSRNLFIELKKFFTREKGLDLTYFWGQDCSEDLRGMDAYYTAADDTWRVLKYKTNSNDVISSISDLRENFDQLHLSSNDKLYFSDSSKAISNEDFETALQRHSDNKGKDNVVSFQGRFKNIFGKIVNY